MIWVSSIILIAYCVALGLLVVGYFLLNRSKINLAEAKLGFSIVIPFRNEDHHLPNLLKSIERLDYPSHLVEIIFVNDASEDNSVALIEEFISTSTSAQRYSLQRIENVRATQSPKKDAILTGIEMSKHPWIVTTDADCQLPRQLLKSYNTHILKFNSAMVCGPIFYSANRSLLQQFQQFDGISLQLVAMGGFGLGHPLLCNGANMAYLKSAFYAVNGFSENDHIASGDDIFLLEKMRRKFPNRVTFLNDSRAIVTTQPQSSWKRLVWQRIRWASKTKLQKNGATQLLGVISFAVNLLVVLGAMCIPAFPSALFWWAPLLCFKLIADSVAVISVSGFFGKRISIFAFLGCGLLYPSILTVVVLGSIRGKYRWKGRAYQKIT
ncbi:MAG: glycosyl transferase [Flavobacteriaceae bacterium]|nr:glycosyl transferase [Flavobacteriaceae bacterium]